MQAIRSMAHRLNLDLSPNRLEEFMERARRLVEDEAASICLLASELLRRRRLDGREIAALVPIGEHAATLWV